MKPTWAAFSVLVLLLLSSSPAQSRPEEEGEKKKTEETKEETEIDISNLKKEHRSIDFGGIDISEELFQAPKKSEPSEKDKAMVLTMLLTSLSSPPPPSNATGVHPPPRPAPTRYGPPPPAPHPYPPKRHSANHKKPIGGFKKPFNYGKSQGRPQRPHLPPPPPPPQPRRNFKAPSRLHQRPKQQQQQQRQQYPRKQKQHPRGPPPPPHPKQHFAKQRPRPKFVQPKRPKQVYPPKPRKPQQQQGPPPSRPQPPTQRPQQQSQQQPQLKKAPVPHKNPISAAKKPTNQEKKKKQQFYVKTEQQRPMSKKEEQARREDARHEQHHHADLHQTQTGSYSEQAPVYRLPPPPAAPLPAAAVVHLTPAQSKVSYTSSSPQIIIKQAGPSQSYRWSGHGRSIPGHSILNPNARSLSFGIGEPLANPFDGVGNPFQNINTKWIPSPENLFDTGLILPGTSVVNKYAANVAAPAPVAYKQPPPPKPAYTRPQPPPQQPTYTKPAPPPKSLFTSRPTPKYTKPAQTAYQTPSPAPSRYSPAAGTFRPGPPTFRPAPVPVNNKPSSGGSYHSQTGHGYSFASSPSPPPTTSPIYVPQGSKNKFNFEHIPAKVYDPASQSFVVAEPTRPQRESGNPNKIRQQQATTKKVTYAVDPRTKTVVSSLPKRPASNFQGSFIDVAAQKLFNPSTSSSHNPQSKIDVFDVPIKVEETFNPAFFEEGGPEVLNRDILTSSKDGNEDVFYIFYENSAEQEEEDNKRNNDDDQISLFSGEQQQVRREPFSVTARLSPSFPSPTPRPPSPSRRPPTPHSIVTAPPNSQFKPPSAEEIRTIYVPIENAINIPDHFDISLSTAFGNKKKINRSRTTSAPRRPVAAAASPSSSPNSRSPSQRQRNPIRRPNPKRARGSVPSSNVGYSANTPVLPRSKGGSSSSSSYDGVSSYDAPITIEKSYTAPQSAAGSSFFDGAGSAIVYSEIRRPPAPVDVDDAAESVSASLGPETADANLFEPPPYGQRLGSRRKAYDIVLDNRDAATSS